MKNYSVPLRKLIIISWHFRKSWKTVLQLSICFAYHCEKCIFAAKMCAAKRAAHLVEIEVGVQIREFRLQRFLWALVLSDCTGVVRLELIGPGETGYRSYDMIRNWPQSGRRMAKIDLNGALEIDRKFVYKRTQDSSMDVKCVLSFATKSAMSPDTAI